jgi:hypothetical protein
MSFIKSISQYTQASSIGPNDLILGNQLSNTRTFRVDTLTQYITGAIASFSEREVGVFTVSVSAPSLSGSFFGDGSNLTGVVGTDATKLSLTGGTLTGGLTGTAATFNTSISAPALSGTFYGDGSNLTGLDAYTPPADATFTSSVSAPALSGTFYGDGSNLTGISTYALPADVTFTGSVSAPALSGTFYGDGSKLTGLDAYTPPADATFTSSVSAPALSGTFYGDGSNLTGLDAYTPPADATFTGSVSAPALSGTFYGDGSKLTGISTYALPADVTFTGSVSAPALSGTFYGDGSKLTGISGGTSFVYPSDLIVSLPGGKTFGRYSNGETIPATGKTPAEVIQMAISAPIEPTVNLTSPTSIAFNQTSINNVLQFSHTINTLGASVSAASLEWRRNNSGSWTQLSTLTNSSFTHTITDTNFNTQPFNYRYTITDTAGASATDYVDVTPAGYVAPSMSITVTGATVTSPETNSTREKGNINSTISGSITKNTANTTLSNYVLQYRVNGGSYIDIGSATNITGDSVSFSGIAHTPAGASSADSVSYRIAVTDNYTVSYSSPSTITFYYFIFYGPTSSVPVDSSGVRALPTKSFTTLSNPFTLNTGTAQVNFVVAMPSTLSITSVIDLDALNANLTSNYVNNPFSVNDGGGNAVAYKVYTCSIATPYSPSHRHQITRG